VTERALLNGTTLCATATSNGKEFDRSVVVAWREWPEGDHHKFYDYGIARFFAEIELFSGETPVHVAKVDW
jgi:hypothetical protein